MHPRKTLSPRVLATLTALSIIASVGPGCSPRSKVNRLLAQAEQDFKAGQYDKAEIEYKNVLQVDGNSAPAFAQLGLIFQQQGREARSLPFLAKAKELNASDSTIRLHFALACLATGNAAEARTEAIALLAQPAPDERVPMLLVEASANPKELEDARQRLQALSSARSAPVLVALGKVALRQGRAKEAEASLEAARAADAKSVVVNSALGTLYWSRNDLPAADAALKRAAEFAPPRSPQKLQYAQFKLQTGERNTGKQLLEEISRQTPDYLPVWVWLAELAAQDKNYPEAEALLAKVLARDSLHPEALILGARVRLAKGEIDKAIAELDRLAAIFPKSAQINYQLGLAYAAKGENNKALSRLAQVSAVAPEMVQPILATAELNLRKRDYGAVISTLKPLVQQHPEVGAARILLAEAHRGKGEFDQATTLYDQLAIDLPRDAQVAFGRGTLRLQQGQADAARAEFRRAREITPGHFGALEQLVGLEISAKNYAAARSLVEADQAKAATSAPHALLLARVCLAQNDRTAAEAALRRAIELEPDSPNALFLLARLYLGSQQPEKALANLQEAVTKSPRNLPALLLLGVINHERKDYPAARDAYEKALAVEPKSSLALNNLAYLYSEYLNQPDKAVELAQRARALLPQDPRTADTLGWALYRKKQYAAAAPVLQESAASLPEEADVHYHLGLVRYALGEEAAARTALQRAVQLNPKLDGAADVRQRLSLLDLDAAKADRATRSSLEKQLAQRSDDTVAQFRLAEILRRDGDFNGALTRYQAVLQASPKHLGALLGSARSYAAKGDLPKALESGRNARTLAPDQPEIAFTVGQMAFQAGDYRWAASLLDEAARQRPDDPEVIYRWAEASYSIGRVAEAEAGLRRILQAGKSFTSSKRATDFLDLAACAAASPLPATAAAKAQQTLASDAHNLPALYLQARLGEQKTDLAAAKKTYEQILARFPDFAPAQKNLALLYAANTADEQKAIALAVKARQSYPNDPALARAIGMAAYRQGDFTKAASLLQESASGGSIDGNLMYYLGMSQWRINRRTDSKRSLQRALELGVSESFATEAKKNLAVTP